MASDLPDRFNFAEEEERILALWARLDAFKTSMELTKDKPEVRARARLSWS
jgi:isoleucyl-tRNA synthetase